MLYEYHAHCSVPIVATDDRTLEAAYSCYRAVIGVKRNLQSGERAGARKQEALKIASDRYRIPMGQLKRGIVHEHTESYKRELAFLEEAGELEKQNIGVCRECKGERDSGDFPDPEYFREVRVRLNPHLSELQGRLVPALSLESSAPRAGPL